ncbi:protein mono-ADP-ribosyltransferase PARP12-like [Salminus brasiliensis]|uniref:protein mono-ADP-ribosyltransferase PARP12-like n=1 Tax=Salminus brasiliensis TaxID=930266 RepID=UPI003B839F7F
MTESDCMKLICARNGAMSYDELIPQFRNNPVSLMFGDSVESIIEDSESLVTVFLNGQKTVVAKSPVKLCRAKDCCGCTNLHLCKFFLFGDCPFSRGRRRCRFCHDLHSEQNSHVLLNNGLSQLDKRELCILLLQSDTSLLPPVCHSYNNGTGPYGRCQDGDNCKRLHICEKYLREPCQCPRSHDFYEPHPLRTLQERGVPHELLPCMKDVYAHIEVLRSQNKNRPPRNSWQRTNKGSSQPQQASANANINAEQRASVSSNSRAPQYSAEKKEICMYFVKGSCKHSDRCIREHSKLPYKWEFKNGDAWAALPNNEEIEKDYCNPAKTYSSGPDPVYFDTMTRGSYTVRRLSTVSSVVQPHFILTTTWTWYWEDEFGNWIQYASASGGHNTASITSEDLEQKYIQDNKAVVDFTAGSQSYTLSFRDMIQTNKNYGTKKLVRRRPVFVSSVDAQTIKTSKRQISFKTLPSHWDKALTPETGYKRVQLQSTSVEYKEIQNMFSATLHGFTILQIERIQNKALWEVFQWQKDVMKKNNAGRNVGERKLFHGTDPKHIDAICLNNFDWRICGTHGTAYGKGSYFAKDAKYSHSYTGDSTVRNMFVCQILVGDYTVGNSSYVRPPSKDGGDTVFYDSCVNDIRNPSIFVVFEKHQIYPEYLIQYREAHTSYSSSPTYHYPAAVNRASYTQTARPSAAATTATSVWPTTAPASTYQYTTAATSTYKPTPTPRSVHQTTPAATYTPKTTAASMSYYAPTYASTRPSTPNRSKSESSCIIC